MAHLVLVLIGIYADDRVAFLEKKRIFTLLFILFSIYDEESDYQEAFRGEGSI